MCLPTSGAAAELEVIQVIGVAPGSSLGIDALKLPFSVQSVDSDDLASTLALDISDYMNANLRGVNINSAQNNPLQPDVQFRGFTASPLLGLSQGIAVYQDGVRINEPLGDSVNWDLLPESAVHSIDLISGASPMFGLNTLGGSLSVKMKNGFNFTGGQAEVYTGSWGRRVGSLEYGDNNGRWGYYLNANIFSEDGWRQLSKSQADNVYGSVSFRSDLDSSIDVIYQQAQSELIGNGAAPVGLLALDRGAVFTAPDITENSLQMFNVIAAQRLNDNVRISANGFWRKTETYSFNGDASEFEACEYASGARSLFEEAGDIEESLEDQLGIELDDICEGHDSSINSFDELVAFIAGAAISAGLNPENFELDDVIGQLSGTGIISDEAINNLSNRLQRSEGFNAQLEFENLFFPVPNQLVLGVSYFSGKASFESVLELSELNPVTRSTEGLGTGSFLGDAETDIDTVAKTHSIFVTDTLSLTEALSLTVSARFNDTGIKLRDRSGARPELNGDHSFSRVNPALGFSYDINSLQNIYGSYSESNRVPTPIELACNEGVFEVAQQYAIARGDDPDDIDFECRLPNAFLADPPLDDVVTKSVELGLRGDWADGNYQIAVFNADNQDDIIFQTTGRSTGLFANVDNTRRRGVDMSASGELNSLHWFASYSYIEATFEDDFSVLSPNHPSANADGEISVQTGDRLPGLPKSLFKFGIDYEITPAFKLGATLVYNSSQVLRGDEANELSEVGGYSVIDLRMSYLVAQNFLLFAKVSNVLDTEYENFGLLGESPAELLPDLSDLRSVFLGAGAPRGAWVGMRVEF